MKGKSIVVANALSRGVSPESLESLEGWIEAIVNVIEAESNSIQGSES